MKRLIPAIPLAAALAVLFTVPARADVMYSPVEQFMFGFGILAIALVLGLICLSVAAVLIIVFVRRARAKKKTEAQK